MSELPEQAAKILGPLAGTATTWSLDRGLRLGVFGLLVTTPSGATAQELAGALELDPQYTHMVLPAAYAAEILDLDQGRYRLAEHMATLLLDADAPVYLPGAPANANGGTTSTPSGRRGGRERPDVLPPPAEPGRPQASRRRRTLERGLVTWTWPGVSVGGRRRSPPPFPGRPLRRSTATGTRSR